MAIAAALERNAVASGVPARRASAGGVAVGNPQRLSACLRRRASKARQVDEALREVGNADEADSRTRPGGVARRGTFGGERFQVGRGLAFRRRMATCTMATIRRRLRRACGAPRASRRPWHLAQVIDSAALNEKVTLSRRAGLTGHPRWRITGTKHSGGANRLPWPRSAGRLATGGQERRLEAVNGRRQRREFGRRVLERSLQ